MSDVSFVTAQSLGVDPDEFSPVERRLFRALSREPHRVITKDELIRGGIAPTTRRLDSAACTLRARFSAAGHRVVVNVWGVGYRLLDPTDA